MFKGHIAASLGRSLSLCCTLVSTLNACEAQSGPDAPDGTDGAFLFET
jgi:hypothetical protein